MNNLIEFVKNLQSSLEKQEESKRQTGRSTKIIDQARKNGSTVVCANYRQKKEFEHWSSIDNDPVRFITLEKYDKEKNSSTKTYLFDHFAIFSLVSEQYSRLIANYDR